MDDAELVVDWPAQRAGGVEDPDAIVADGGCGTDEDGALERGIHIAAIVNPEARETQMLGIPVYRDFGAVPAPFDGAVIADLQNAQQMLAMAEDVLGVESVALPPFLRASLPGGAAA